MSIAEFYLDHGIDPDDPDGMENFLAGTFGDFSGPGSYSWGAGSSAGRKRPSSEVDNFLAATFGGKRARGEGDGGRTCPACKKTFGSSSAMQQHYSGKQDARHAEHRREAKDKTTAEAHAQRPAEIRQQIEYYLSDAALFKWCKWQGKTIGKDVSLLWEMAKDPGQWVRLSFLASYPKLQTLVPSGDVATLAAAVSGSQTLELSAAGTEVRRNQTMPRLPGMIGALMRGELILVQHDYWIRAVWKDEKGWLQTDTEKAQQSGQLGCVPPGRDGGYYDSEGEQIPGAIDLRKAIKEAPKEVREGNRQGKIWRPCRWGVACPRLSTDESHTAKAHTPEQARLAESTGVTAAIRALGGRWWTEEMQEEALEAQCCQPDACPCFKSGTLQVCNSLGAAYCFGGFGYCNVKWGPDCHSQNYWKGQETVAKLAQLEPGVDQSPAVWKAKREARAKHRRLQCSIFEVRGITAAPADLLNGVYEPRGLGSKGHQRWMRECCRAWPSCPHYRTMSSTDDVWIQFDDAARRYQFKQGSDASYEKEAQAVVLMQSSVIGGEAPVPAPPDAPAPARCRVQTPPLEPPACSPEEASGWEVYNAGSKQWEAQQDVVIKFHSFS